jgi:hypothetical protein
MTRSTSSLVCEFVTDLKPGEEFTARQIFELLEQDGATHAAVSGTLHRLVRLDVLTITRKDCLGCERKSYVFCVVNPHIPVTTNERRHSACGFTRTDTHREPLFKE